MTRFGVVHSRWPGGIGSGVKTSSTAPGQVAGVQQVAQYVLVQQLPPADIHQTRRRTAGIPATCGSSGPIVASVSGQAQHQELRLRHYVVQLRPCRRPRTQGRMWRRVGAAKPQ